MSVNKCKNTSKSNKVNKMYSVNETVMCINL